MGSSPRGAAVWRPLARLDRSRLGPKRRRPAAHNPARFGNAALPNSPPPSAPNPTSPCILSGCLFCGLQPKAMRVCYILGLLRAQNEVGREICRCSSRRCRRLRHRRSHRCKALAIWRRAKECRIVPMSCSWRRASSSHFFKTMSRYDRASLLVVPMRNTSSSKVRFAAWTVLWNSSS